MKPKRCIGVRECFLCAETLTPGISLWTVMRNLGWSVSPSSVIQALRKFLRLPKELSNIDLSGCAQCLGRISTVFNMTKYVSLENATVNARWETKENKESRPDTNYAEILAEMKAGIIEIRLTLQRVYSTNSSSTVEAVRECAFRMRQVREQLIQHIKRTEAELEFDQPVVPVNSMNSGEQNPKSKPSQLPYVVSKPAGSRISRISVRKKAKSEPGVLQRASMKGKPATDDRIGEAKCPIPKIVRLHNSVPELQKTFLRSQKSQTQLKHRMCLIRLDNLERQNQPYHKPVTELPKRRIITRSSTVSRRVHRSHDDNNSSRKRVENRKRKTYDIITLKPRKSSRTEETTGGERPAVRNSNTVSHTRPHRRNTVASSNARPMLSNYDSVIRIRVFRRPSRRSTLAATAKSTINGDIGVITRARSQSRNNVALLATNEPSKLENLAVATRTRSKLRTSMTAESKVQTHKNDRTVTRTRSRTSAAIKNVPIVERRVTRSNSMACSKFKILRSFPLRERQKNASDTAQNQVSSQTKSKKTVKPSNTRAVELLKQNKNRKSEKCRKERSNQILKLKPSESTSSVENVNRRLCRWAQLNPEYSKYCECGKDPAPIQPNTNIKNNYVARSGPSRPSFEENVIYIDLVPPETTAVEDVIAEKEISPSEECTKAFTAFPAPDPPELELPNQVLNPVKPTLEEPFLSGLSNSFADEIRVFCESQLPGPQTASCAGKPIALTETWNPQSDIQILINDNVQIQDMHSIRDLDSSDIIHTQPETYNCNYYAPGSSDPVFNVLDFDKHSGFGGLNYITYHMQMLTENAELPGSLETVPSSTENSAASTTENTTVSSTRNNTGSTSENAVVEHNGIDLTAVSGNQDEEILPNWNQIIPEAMYMVLNSNDTPQDYLAVPVQNLEPELVPESNHLGMEHQTTNELAVMHMETQPEQPLPVIIHQASGVDNVIEVPVETSGETAANVLIRELESYIRNMVADSDPDNAARDRRITTRSTRKTSQKSAFARCTVPNCTFQYNAETEAYRLPAHIKRRHEGIRKCFICSTCNSGFGDYKSLRTHQFRHSGERPFHCKMEDCEGKFRSNRQLRAHQASYHNKGNFRFSCNVCEKKYMKKYNFQLHVNSHTGEKPLQCEKCGKRFKGASSFRYHRIRCYPDDASLTQYPCDKCTKVFATKTSLKCHRLKIHGESGIMNALQCQICCYLSANGRSGLERHTLMVHSENKSEQCGECQRQFKTKSTLRNHIRSVHSQERPHVCPTCDRGFLVRSKLERHLMSHGGKRTVFCGIGKCPKAFFDNPTANRHRRMTHKIKLNAISGENEVDDSVPGAKKRRKVRTKDKIVFHQPEDVSRPVIPVVPIPISSEDMVSITGDAETPAGMNELQAFVSGFFPDDDEIFITGIDTSNMDV